MKRWSVVIPTLNEEASLPGCVASVRAGGPAEVIVSDGGSADRTAALAHGLADRLVVGPAGRGQQLNRGAGAATGTHLLFLHADARVPPAWLKALDRAFCDPRPPAASVFRVRYDAPQWAFRLIEGTVHLRCRLLKLAYGDHGFALRRADFARIGGFPEIPIMEDVAFCRSLKRLGSLRLLGESLTLSPRRQGRRPLRTALRNHALLLLYGLGVAPEKLYRLYYPLPPRPGEGIPKPGSTP